MAHQLKSKAASQFIAHICNSNNDLIVNTIEINTIFKNYFLNLYTSESPESNSEKLKFLDNMELPTLNSVQKINLDKPMQMEFFLNSITLMQCKTLLGLMALQQTSKKKKMQINLPLFFLTLWKRVVCHKP